MKFFPHSAAIVAVAVQCLATVGRCADERWFDPLARTISPAYRRVGEQEQSLRQELAGLPEAPVSQQSESVGWHSRFAPNPNVTKWLQVDFGRIQPFEAVVLVPVDVAYGARLGPGFGFPLRFRVEASDDAAFSEPRLIAAYDDADFPNPGNAPVFLPASGAEGRFIRVTATRLWPRGDLALFALGEVFVLHGGMDIAAGAPVTASDSYENAPMWQPANATDGQSVLGPPVRITSTPGNGWHAQIAKAPDVPKWVQVDLGKEWPLDEVRLYPARPKDFPARRGFGFPPRFRVEVANDADFAHPTMLFDQTQADFVNPAENAVIIPGHAVSARFVRVTATELWERTNDFIFALAELEAYSGGRNVALGTAVSSLDSIEVPSWSRRFLVDGFNSQGQIMDLSDWLRGLSRRREIEQQLAYLEIERSRQASVLASSAARWIGGAAFVIAVALGWWMLRRARARRREVEELRQRIASDLHDEIGSNLGSIALLSQMALRESGGARADLEEINRVARETAASMRDIVWLIKPGSAAPDDFVLKLRETAGMLLTGLEWTFEGEPPAHALSLEWKREVLLIFKEALHNIRRHAAAHQVGIRLKDAEGEFALQITDDGAGFDPEASTTGHGLTSQRQRARALGGDLRIESAPGGGTRLTLRAKWNGTSLLPHP